MATFLKREISSILPNKSRVLKGRKNHNPQRTSWPVFHLDFKTSSAILVVKVKLFQRNGVWYLRFRLNNKRLMRSTREREREKALLKIREVVNNASGKESLRETKAIPTFTAFALEFFNNVRRTYKTSTYKGDKRRIRNLLPYFGKMKLNKITLKDVDDYREKRLKQPIKNGTVNRDTELLNRILNKAVTWELLKDNPIKKLKRLKEPRDRIRWLRREEETRLLDACKISENPLLYYIVKTALLTGMRKSELQNLTWDDVDLELRQITLENTKNGEVAYTPINQYLLPLLVELRNKYPQARYVFCNIEGGPYGDWRRSFNTSCRLAGVNDFHFHDLRHSFASSLVRQGIALAVVQKLMRHKSIQMTLRYAHLAPHQTRQAIDQLVPADIDQDTIGAKVVQSYSNQN